jgi:hypothetical protein
LVGRLDLDHAQDRIEGALPQHQALGTLMRSVPMRAPLRERFKDHPVVSARKQ